MATGKWENGYAGTWRVGTNGGNETCGRGLAAGTHDWERGARAGTPWLGNVIGSDPWRTATRREPEIGSHDRDRLFRQQGADGVEGQERNGDGRYARLRVPVGERIHHAIVIRGFNWRVVVLARAAVLRAVFLVEGRMQVRPHRQKVKGQDQRHPEQRRQAVQQQGRTW